MFAMQSLVRSGMPISHTHTHPRPMSSELTGLKLVQGAVQKQQNRTSQTTRDMRAQAQSDYSERFDEWQARFFQNNPSDEDRLRAIEFDQLVNDHMELFEHTPRRSADGDGPAGPSNFSCMIAPDVELGSALKHLDTKVRLLSLSEIQYFANHKPTKELLLAGENGRLPKLTKADQKALAFAIQSVLPEIGADQVGAKVDPRNHVLLIQQGTNLDEVRTRLSMSYPIPISKDAWRDFISCIPNDTEKVTSDVAVNTWPLFDLCIQNACNETSNSHMVSQMVPLYQWMLAGQKNGLFSESDVANCRVRIVEQALSNFLGNMVKRNGKDGLNPEGAALIKNFGVPLMERSVLRRLFQAQASDEVFDQDIYAGAKAFTHWFEAASPGILGFCDRSKPVSIVSPNDDRWHALGIESEDLPLVCVHPDVPNSEIKKFLVGLGGSVIESFGLVEGLGVFGSEKSREESEDRVFSIAKMRNRFISQFMMQLMVEPQVALAKEFHLKMVDKGFPREVLELTRSRYENTVRSSIGQLFEANNKPMLLFSVPKLHDFVTKIIDFSLGVTTLSQYVSQNNHRQQSPVEAILMEHLRSIDKK